MLMKNVARFKLPIEGTFQPNNDDDPLPYYYKSVVGSLYRYRIQQGLSLLSPPYEDMLEFGYGSGLLLPTLAAISGKLYGVNTASNPDVVHCGLKKLDIKAELYKNDLIKIKFPESSFDLIVAFSVFEHIHDSKEIIKEMFRVLKPNGRLLIGMPRVDKNMVKLFKLIGYDQIERHHVADYKSFLIACDGFFRLEKESRLFPSLPQCFGLYFNMLLNKAAK